MTIANLDRTIDTELVLRASGEAAETATGSEATYIDLGPGYHRFDVFVDVTAIEVASNDELYRINILGSNDATPFSSETLVLGTLTLGALEVLIGSSDSTTGIYTLPCHNISKGAGGLDTACRYIKVAYVISGTVATGIDFNCWLAKRT